jgi:hypothetical protein
MIALLRKFNGIVRVHRSVKFRRSPTKETERRLAFDVWQREPNSKARRDSSGRDCPYSLEHMESVTFWLSNADISTLILNGVKICSKYAIVEGVRTLVGFV